MSECHEECPNDNATKHKKEQTAKQPLHLVTLYWTFFSIEIRHGVLGADIFQIMIFGSRNPQTRACMYNI